ncbi:outer membrane lipoprotein carrier protein LolA [Thaumasiovibrio sp. DFM-14]|uniref:outer membrane lipoprotein carrier protein LolA n=1 Tax=Thaumasiovibrio sp. DFM-14 TaxID=3384792 RepID=UPI0039A32BD7
MFKRLLVLIFISSSLPLLAALEHGEANAMLADPALSDIEALLQQRNENSGQFQQRKTLPGLNQPLLSSGEYLIDQQRGMVWQQQRPFTDTLVIRAGKLFHYQQGEYSLSDAPEAYASMVTMLLDGLLAGQVVALSSQGVLDAQIEQQHWRVELIPSVSPLNQLFAQIHIVGNKGCVTQIDLLEQQGGETRISLSCNNNSSDLGNESRSETLRVLLDGAAALSTEVDDG